MVQITREEWLVTATKLLDEQVFGGAFEVEQKGFQIACAKAGSKGYSFVLPYQGEDVELDDFFPITITIDYREKDIKQILVNLAYVMVKAFNGDPRGKQLKGLLKQYFFEKPFSSPHPSMYLNDLIEDVYNSTVNECGEWPGKPIVDPKKEKKEKQPNYVIFFCPECGLEYKVLRKKLKDTGGCPTCICGNKTGKADDTEGNVNE